MTFPDGTLGFDAGVNEHLEPFVGIWLGDKQIGQVTPEECAEIGTHALRVAEAACNDAALAQVLGGIGQDDEDQQRILSTIIGGVRGARLEREATRDE
jgi:hypothetical protein